MLIEVPRGKGSKDRYSTLSVKLLGELRQYYRICRPTTYLFPSSFKKRKDQPLSYSAVRCIYEKARKKARKKVEKEGCKEKGGQEGGQEGAEAQGEKSGF